MISSHTVQGKKKLLKWRRRYGRRLVSRANDLTTENDPGANQSVVCFAPLSMSFTLSYNLRKDISYNQSLACKISTQNWCKTINDKETFKIHHKIKPAQQLLQKYATTFSRSKKLHTNLTARTLYGLFRHQVFFL